MKPETKTGKQLQNFNRVAGVTHLIQAVALFLFLMMKQQFQLSPDSLMKLLMELHQLVRLSLSFQLH